MTQEFKALKFRIANEDQSKRLQEVLFKLGHSWSGRKVVQNTHYKRIDTWADTYLTHGDGMIYKASNNSVEQDTEEFIKMHTKDVVKSHVNVDVIKAWADGITIQVFYNSKWYDAGKDTFQFSEVQQVRIKPEPVEVWQWAYGWNSKESRITSAFYASEQEVKDSFLCKPDWAVKLEPTKKLVEQ